MKGLGRRETKRYKLLVAKERNYNYAINSVGNVVNSYVIPLSGDTS